MKSILLLLMALLLLVLQAPAAFTPVLNQSAAHPLSVAAQPVKKESKILSLSKKPTLKQKIALKLAQKKWFQKWMYKASAIDRTTKDKLGLIAFIAGILLVIATFVVPIITLALAPIAIVTGILAVSRNPNRKSFTLGLIGLILGCVYLLILLLLLVVALAWVNGW